VNSTSTNELSFAKFNKIDILAVAILMIIPVLIFNNILKPGFISFFDLPVPANWMNIYPNSIESYIAGLNYYNTIVSANLNYSFSVISLILTEFLGPYGAHIADIIPQILLGPFAYLFSRYFITDRRVSFILSLFVMFNPFVMEFNFDNITNIYSYEFIMPFIISYIELRIKKNSRAAPFVMLFFLLPSIYGSIPLLYAGVVIVLEISYLIASLGNLRRFLSKLLFLPVIIATYLLINIGTLLNISGINASLGNVILAPNKPQPPHFNFIQIISFRAVYPYQNGFRFLFPLNISGILENLLLIFFLLVALMLILRSVKIVRGKNTTTLTLFFFTILFFIYSLGILSAGSDYFYINRLIFLLFPSINFPALINLWDNGIFMVIFYVSAVISLVIPTEQRKMGTNPTIRNPRKKLVNIISSKRAKQAYLAVTLTIILITSAFYVVSSIGLNNSYGPDVVPEIDVAVYKFLENNSNGFFLTVPTTHAVSFNYDKIYVDAFGMKIGTADTDFWWNFPPSRFYLSGPFFSDIVNSLYYGNNASSRNEFDNLATLSGIEYVINFNPETVASAFGSLSLSNAYISSHTDFKLILDTNEVSIFQNPYYRGLSYTSSDFLVSSNTLNDTVKESRMNLSLPVVTPTQFNYLSTFASVKGVTFNETLLNETNRNVSLLVGSSLNDSVIEPNTSDIKESLSSISYQTVYTIVFQNGSVGLVLGTSPIRDNPSIIVSVLANFPSSSDRESNSQFIVDGMENIVVAFHIVTYLYEDERIYLGNLIYIIGLGVTSVTCLLVILPLRKMFHVCKTEE
jgi:hypothetical protein